MKFRVLAVTAVLAVYVPFALYFARQPVVQDEGLLQRPFPHQGLYSWLARPLVPGSLTDSPDAPRAATLVVLEDGHPLGPGHTELSEITYNGSGRYRYWSSPQEGRILVFSTSDNSDPNTNGRTYRIVDPAAHEPYSDARRR
ncbi:hypothetical protein [Bradyrhizobium guangdongense]|uniref:Uncharacterized protein n=1 Tax=Bradyrhizobium guangdongense TaxID=1325090 RepID=A0AA87W366_9BRAD|nr:hypothetical protein [Bradyrhizobium guangdongense]GGI23879.1 hypothetical protein GCM10010987_26590 [Bradyrhizobium guangdongense]